MQTRVGSVGSLEESIALCITFSIVSIYTILRFGFYSVVTTVKSNIVSYDEEPDSLNYWRKPPLKLLHSMSDKELLWRASFVPQIKKYQLNRLPKIAFMFLDQEATASFTSLGEVFEGPSIFIHCHPSMPSFLLFMFSTGDKSQVSEWGKMSMYDAERRVLANALLDISNNGLSSSPNLCIALYNFSAIYRYLKKSNYSFVGAFDDPGPFGRGLYHENMAPEVYITQWRNGSRWFDIHQKLAVNIVGDHTSVLRQRALFLHHV